MIATYLFLISLILGMNVIPAFMPPTWTVLALYHIKYHLDIIPLVLIGATFATLGRVLLAYLSRHVFIRFLKPETKDNMEALGKYLEAKNKITVPIMLIYAFLPIPSNQVYIAAGLAKFDIRLLATSFFLGRLLSYSFWITAASRVADNVEGLFDRHYSNIGNFVGELIGFGLLYLVSVIGWKKFLKSQKLK